MMRRRVEWLGLGIICIIARGVLGWWVTREGTAMGRKYIIREKETEQEQTEHGVWLLDNRNTSNTHRSQLAGSQPLFRLPRARACR